jgi:hypothetical protein
VRPSSFFGALSPRKGGKKATVGKKVPRASPWFMDFGIALGVFSPLNGPCREPDWGVRRWTAAKMAWFCGVRFWTLQGRAR